MSQPDEVQRLAAEVRRQLMTPWQRFAVFATFLGSVVLWLLFAALPVFDDATEEPNDFSPGSFSDGPSGREIVVMFATFLLIPLATMLVMTIMQSRARSQADG